MQRNLLAIGGLLLLFFFSLISSQLFAQDSDADLADPIDTTDIIFLSAKGPGGASLSDAVLRDRMSKLNSCVDVRMTGVVKGYIKTYAQIQTEKTRNMLGKRLTYFPLFEEKLKEQGLPTDLKYLSVVESALNAKAVSKVGATGLWQFMSYTGKDYGLNATSAYDDRSNPVKSTEAAARYLKSLYNQYQDWALALAAYNSGPNRVNGAIKRAHSRSFWSIQRYLPQETRNYVPAFIAATYICNYFPLHGLEPRDPDFDEQMTDYLLVYEGLSFRDIAAATGLDVDVVSHLNPGFRRGYVPPSNSGQYVIVPQRVMPAFVRYLNSLGSSHNYSFDETDYVEPQHMGDGRYWQKFVTITQPDNIENIAAKYGCHPEHVKSWNALETNYVYAGQKLKLWYPVVVLQHQNVRIEAPVLTSGKTKKPEANTPSGKKKESEAITAAAAPALVRREESPKMKQYLMHTVRRNETLDDIARAYNIPASTIRKINDFSTLSVGMRLKIREL